MHTAVMYRVSQKQRSGWFSNFDFFFNLIACDKMFSSKKTNDTKIVKFGPVIRLWHSMTLCYFQLFACFHTWTCLEQLFIRLLKLQHWSVQTKQRKNVGMAQLVLRFEIIWVKSRKTCISKDDHIIKSTKPIAMILVSFFLEDTCTCILSDTIKTQMTV